MNSLSFWIRVGVFLVGFCRNGIEDTWMHFYRQCTSSIWESGVLLSHVRLFATPWTVACCLWATHSSVHGIFQARALEWVAISFSRRSSRPRDWTRVSRTAGRRFTLWATSNSGSHSHQPCVPMVTPKELPGLANKDAGCSVRFEFRMSRMNRLS